MKMFEVGGYHPRQDEENSYFVDFDDSGGRSETSFVHCCCRHFSRWEGLLLSPKRWSFGYVESSSNKTFLLLIHPIFQRKLSLLGCDCHARKSAGNFHKCFHEWSFILNEMDCLGFTVMDNFESVTTAFKRYRCQSSCGASAL